MENPNLSVMMMTIENPLIQMSNIGSTIRMNLVSFKLYITIIAPPKMCGTNKMNSFYIIKCLERYKSKINSVIQKGTKAKIKRNKEQQSGFVAKIDSTN